MIVLVSITLMTKKITLEQLQCSRCGYTWYPRIDAQGLVHKPLRCASNTCNSPYWDKPRKEMKK